MMWPTGGGYYIPSPQGGKNPVPQQSDPKDWAAKAAQWRTVQAQAAMQQQQQYQQQYQQQLALQQQQYQAQQQTQPQYQQVAGLPQQQPYQQQPTVAYQQPYSQPAYSQPVYSQPTYSQPAYSQPVHSQPTPSQQLPAAPNPVSKPVYAQPAQMTTAPQPTPSTQPSAPPIVSTGPPAPLLPTQSPQVTPNQQPKPLLSASPQQSSSDNKTGPGYITRPPNNDPPANNYRPKPQMQSSFNMYSRPRNPNNVRPRGQPQRHRGQRYRGSRPFRPYWQAPRQYSPRGPSRDYHQNLAEQMPYGSSIKKTYSGSSHNGPYEDDEDWNMESSNYADSHSRANTESSLYGDSNDQAYSENSPYRDNHNQVNTQSSPYGDNRTQLNIQSSSSHIPRMSNSPAADFSQSHSGQGQEQDYIAEHEESVLYKQDPPQPDVPTIASLRKSGDSGGGIPGLGDFTLQPAVQSQTDSHSEPPKSDQTQKMLASLDQLMTDLKGLKGLKNSLEILQQSKKTDGTEEAKKKAAALLANESDSEGEAQPQASKEQQQESLLYTSEKESPSREFKGYNVKVKQQEYDYYPPSQDEYPPPQEDYQPHQDSYPPSRDQYQPPAHRPPDNYRGREEYPHKGYEAYSYPKPPPGDGYYPVPPERELEKYPDRPEGPFERADWGDYEGGYRGKNFPPGRFPPETEEGPPTKYPPYQRPYHDGEFRRPPSFREEFPQRREFSRPPPRDIDHYTEPPVERPFSSSQIKSIDYGHGETAPAIVDYNHGKGEVVTTPAPSDVYNKQEPQSEVSGYGFSTSVPYFPAGVDPAQVAVLAAALSLQQQQQQQQGEKRKTLPAWMRDELEKMEAKRQKEIKKDKRSKDKSSSEAGRSWRDEINSDEESSDIKSRSKRSYRQKSNSPTEGAYKGSPPVKKKKTDTISVEDEEEKEVSKIMKLRRMLTEILLEVTNQEIDSVVKEVYEEEKKAKHTKKPTTPVSIGGGNVLAGIMSMYDSGDDSGQEDKEEKLNLDPLAVAKAFADTVVDPSIGAPPPSREQKEWAEKILDLTPRSVRKEKKSSKSKEKKSSHSDRRSSQDSHKRSSSHSSRESSGKSSRKSIDSSEKIKKSERHPKAHSPPPPSGISMSKSNQQRLSSRAIKKKSPSPNSPVRKRKHSSRAESPSLKSERKVLYRNKESIVPTSSSRSQDKDYKIATNNSSRGSMGSSREYRIVATRK